MPPLFVTVFHMIIIIHLLDSSLTIDTVLESFKFTCYVYWRFSVHTFICHVFFKSIATGQESGREPEDPAYDLVTKTFFSLEHHRDKYR